MRVLLTGASSFTGYWFAEALHRSGHRVVAPLRQARSAYPDGVRAERVRRLAAVADIVEDCAFGSPAFIALAASGFDVICHHAAEVGDYRSPAFDVAAALAANTLNLREILAAAQPVALRAVVLTGSVFEPNEGAGTMPLNAFSAYGLSKGFTAELVAHHCRAAGVPVHRFVVSNPFGPLEEPRFCAYLLRTWKAGEIARVNTPAYVRDNIHISLLSAAYARFVADAAAGAAPDKLNPSGYVESQGAFAERYARELRARLGLACALDLATQTEFPEPPIRINTEPATRYIAGWDETAAWDEVARAAAA